MRLLLSMLILAFGLSDASAAEAPRVVVSIKPLHSLVAGVMEGVGEPLLLMEGASSPHGYSLRPSQARAIHGADLVVWIGEGLMATLKRPIAARDGRSLEVAELDGITALPLRLEGLHHGDDEQQIEAQRAGRGQEQHPGCAHPPLHRPEASGGRRPPRVARAAPRSRRRD